MRFNDEVAARSDKVRRRGQADLTVLPSQEDLFESDRKLSRGRLDGVAAWTAQVLAILYPPADGCN